jgi:ubiquinone/menaquinone biosynthesis C-methylase UbiE
MDSRMHSSNRLAAEQAFHNRQARERAADLHRGADALSIVDAAYLDHESWIRPAFERLGDLQGLHVLDFGCGHGMAAVVLARQGARVTAFDLSGGYLDEARRRAHANHVDVQFVQADGECLPFADASFDRVWGNAVLHHLDLRSAGRELYRILKPGGLAVFSEPWGENRLLQWARRKLPYPGKHRTEDEEPLCRRDLEVLSSVFPGVSSQGHQFISMIRRVLRQRQLIADLDYWDSILLERVPALQKYCRYIVLTLCRPHVMYNDLAPAP